MAEEKIVVLDSHVLLWLMLNPRRVSQKARRELRSATKIVVPIIVLLEVLHILEKHQKERTFSDVLLFLKENEWMIYPLDRNVLLAALRLPKMEMHDRIIVATASLFDAVILSKDKEMHRLYPRTVW